MVRVLWVLHHGGEAWMGWGIEVVGVVLRVYAKLTLHFLHLFQKWETPLLCKPFNMASHCYFVCIPIVKGMFAPYNPSCIVEPPSW